jgi:hypothetical protein
VQRFYGGGCLAGEFPVVGVVALLGGFCCLLGSVGFVAGECGAEHLEGRRVQEHGDVAGALDFIHSPAQLVGVGGFF